MNNVKWVPRSTETTQYFLSRVNRGIRSLLYGRGVRVRNYFQTCCEYRPVAETQHACLGHGTGISPVPIEREFTLASPSVNSRPIEILVPSVPWDFRPSIFRGTNVCHVGGGWTVRQRTHDTPYVIWGYGRRTDLRLPMTISSSTSSSTV